jgi:hypothetical protein
VCKEQKEQIIALHIQWGNHILKRENIENEGCDPREKGNWAVSNHIGWMGLFQLYDGDKNESTSLGRSK